MRFSPIPKSTPGIEKPVAIAAWLLVLALVCWRVSILLIDPQSEILGTWYSDVYSPDSITFYADGTAAEYKSKSESIERYRYIIADRPHIRLAREVGVSTWDRPACELTFTSRTSMTIAWGLPGRKKYWRTEPLVTSSVMMPRERLRRILASPAVHQGRALR